MAGEQPGKIGQADAIALEAQAGDNMIKMVHQRLAERLLARSMNASFGAQLRHVRLMAALPALGSGLRMAAAVAPIGAIIGEWVGSAEGLGYVMLNANARLQTDICFAALFILVLLTLLLWLAVDTLLHRLIDWSPE